MVPALDPRSNQILAALAEEERERWRDDLEPVELSLGQVLFEPGVVPAHVVFPTTAVVSLLQVVQPGTTAEIAVVGHEGVVGIALAMGDEAAPSRAVVQSAGHGYRLAGRALHTELRLMPMLLLLRFAQALVMQMAQTALCVRQHSLEQQLCRWLLLSLDRLHGSELVMTQELMAAMLAASRQDIVAGALRLQGAGLIRYAPGHITVIDRAGLSLRTCGCYAEVKREYDRLRPVRAASP